jgi:hypothetical protein
MSLRNLTRAVAEGNGALLALPALHQELLEKKIPKEGWWKTLLGEVEFEANRFEHASLTFFAEAQVALTVFITSRSTARQHTCIICLVGRQRIVAHLPDEAHGKLRPCY